MGYVTARRSLLKALFGSTCAAALILGQQPLGLALDFVNQSILIRDNTLANRFASTGILDSAGNLIGPGAKLTYTSPSPKLCLQSNGFYQYGAHNLILRSEAFDNGSWTTSNISVTANAVADPNGALTADALIPANGLVNATIRQGVTSIAQTSYIWQVYLKNGTLGNNWCEVTLQTTPTGTVWRAWFNLSTGVKGTSSGSPTDYTITSVGNGWYRCAILVKADDTNLNCYIIPRNADGNASNVTGDGTSPAAYAWGGMTSRYPVASGYVQTTSAAVYTLPYEYNTSAVCQGILVEEARTNLCLSMNSFAGATTSLTATANSVTGIDGLTSGCTLVPVAASASHHVLVAAANWTSGATACQSFFIKPNGYNRVYMHEPVNTGAYAVFLCSGAGSIVSSGAGGTGTITAIGNGWYRCIMTYAGGGAANINLGIVDASYASGNPNAYTWTADGTSGVIVQWFQAETGAFATSPIITGTATVVRAVDNIKILTSAFPSVTAACSMYASIVNGPDTSTYRQIMQIDDASNNNRISLAQSTSAGYQSRLTTSSGGTDYVDAFWGTVTANTAYKVAVAYKSAGVQADQHMSFNGSANPGPTLTNSPTVAPVSPATLWIGTRINGSNTPFQGYMKALMVVPVTLTNAQGNALTTP